jgi:hypothetical protein
VLVLFIAALAEGLADANRQYLSKLDAQLIVLGDRADGILTASRVGRSRMAAVERVDGVASAGAIGFSSATIIAPQTKSGAPLRVSLVGVEPGKPGEPTLQGRGLSTIRRPVVLDRSVLNQLALSVGDPHRRDPPWGTQNQTYTLRVVGISDGQTYLFQPTLFIYVHRIASAKGRRIAGAELTVGAMAVDDDRRRSRPCRRGCSTASTRGSSDRSPDLREPAGLLGGERSLQSAFAAHRRARDRQVLQSDPQKVPQIGVLKPSVRATRRSDGGADPAGHLIRVPSAARSRCCSAWDAGLGAWRSRGLGWRLRSRPCCWLDRSAAACRFGIGLYRAAARRTVNPVMYAGSPQRHRAYTSGQPINAVGRLAGRQIRQFIVLVGPSGSGNHAAGHPGGAAGAQPARS